MSHTDFALASGGVIGRDHRQTFKNYQDACLVTRTNDYTLGVVADGCGSGLHSEVGASLGVRLLNGAICSELATGHAINWSRLQQRLLAKLDVLVEQLGGSYRQAVEDYFLFTTNGVLLTDERAVFFALGDGIIIVNGAEYQLGPFVGNMPPYLGYGLIPDSLQIDMKSISLRPVLDMPLAKLEHFVLGSDGLVDFMQAAEVFLPGTSTPCGEIAQFWQNDRYFGANADLVSRQLRLAARDWPRRDPQPGLLSDDTTLVVGRRTH